MGVKNNPDGVRPGHCAHCQQWVVGGGGAGAHDHGVDECPETVEVFPILLTRDEAGIACTRGDETIDALAQLCNNQTITGLHEGAVTINEFHRPRAHLSDGDDGFAEMLPRRLGWLRVMLHAAALDRQVGHALRPVGHMEMLTTDHGDAQRFQGDLLGGIGGEQSKTTDAKVPQDRRTLAVVAGVNWEPKVSIGIHCVAALVLQCIRPQLVEQPDSSPLVTPHVDERTGRRLTDRLKGCLELLAAITAIGAQRVAREALRVNTDQWRFHRGRATPAPDKRDVSRSVCTLVADHFESSMAGRELRCRDAPNDDCSFIPEFFERHAQKDIAWTKCRDNGRGPRRDDDPDAGGLALVTHSALANFWRIPDEVLIHGDRRSHALGIALTGCSSTPVEQQVWVLESFAGESVPASSESLQGVTSQFSLADGTVTGDGGVNNFNGTYRLSDKDISFSPLASTRMAGSPEAMEQETRFSRLWSPRPTSRSETRQ